MKQADFYLLTDDTSEVYTQSVCGLVYQKWQKGSTVYLYCESLELAKQFDDKLWTFKDTAFLPHHILSTASLLTVELPVCVIGFPELSHKLIPSGVLFNLTQSLPAFTHRYQKVIEVVGVSEASRVQSRKRYRHYQKEGYVMQTHAL